MNMVLNRLPLPVQSDIEKISGLRFDEDRFDNLPYDLDDFPNFRTHISELLDAESCCLYVPKNRSERVWDAGIGEGMFDLQAHTASVDEHTDDVKRGCYFGLFVLKRNFTEFKNRSWFDCRTELRYFNELGAKERTRLDVGKLIIFNPRRNHELIYFGDKTTFLLFDVRKLKTK